MISVIKQVQVIIMTNYKTQQVDDNFNLCLEKECKMIILVVC